MKGGDMQKKLLGGVLSLLVIVGLVMLASCAKEAVQTTTPEEEPQVTEESAEDKAAAEEAARREAEKRAMEEEAIRREKEAARNKFINEDIYFDFDDSSLTAGAQAMLREKAAWMRNNPDALVVIEGHCDERGTAEYNLALGDRRAASAKSFLKDLGVSAFRIRTISYGEEMPVDKGSTEAAWAKNRRAHFDIE
jgi:peptidoglycan-associated lipoprotein